MKNILYPADLAALPTNHGDTNAWTALIAAGGKGTRLGPTFPKPLYPILGKPMIEWIIEACLPSFGRFVIVTSPSNDEEVRKHVRSRFPDLSAAFEVQTQGVGTAAAIECGLKSVVTSHVAVLWCDQVTVRSETLRWCLIAHGSRPGATLTFPTTLRKNPYVYFKRDEVGRLLAVAQMREGDRGVDLGESDCGIFLFDTQRLREIFNLGSKLERYQGKKTGELNVLSLLPLFDLGAGEALTLQIAKAEETIGVNSPEDVLEAEQILKRRLCEPQRTKTTR